MWYLYFYVPLLSAPSYLWRLTCERVENVKSGPVVPPLFFFKFNLYPGIAVHYTVTGPARPMEVPLLYLRRNLSSTQQRPDGRIGSRPGIGKKKKGRVSIQHHTYGLTNLHLHVGQPPRLMANPTLWTQKSFRPFGNISPISLTAHLLLEEDADILCLTYSNLHHILYTIHCRSVPSEHRSFRLIDHRFTMFSPMQT